MHRTAQQHSPTNSQPNDGVYVTPNPTRQAQQPQPQYNVIQLGQTQHGPDAGHYDSLNPQTQGLEPQYDVISRRYTNI